MTTTTTFVLTQEEARALLLASNILYQIDLHYFHASGHLYTANDLQNLHDVAIGRDALLGSDTNVFIRDMQILQKLVSVEESEESK